VARRHRHRVRHHSGVRRSQGNPICSPRGDLSAADPVIVLLGLLAITAGGLGNFSIEKLYVGIPADSTTIDVNSGLMSSWQVVAILCVYVVGFFATAEQRAPISPRTAATIMTSTSAESPAFYCPRCWPANSHVDCRRRVWRRHDPKEHIGCYNPVILMSDILQTKFGAARGDMIANITMIALAVSSFREPVFHR